VDSFDYVTIRNLITGYYQKNLASLLDHIYHDFVEARGANFKCSKKTFRRILRSLNYQYKFIDRRAALIQRPEIVLQRENFHRAIRENDAAPDSQKPELVYIDETWIGIIGRIAMA
jgi:hypothetical protein